MGFPTKLSQLCTPAYVYFLLSILGYVVALLQNLTSGDSRRYRLGVFSCRVPSCFIVFVLKIMYILFWTWILNMMCRDGHSGIAWFLVLLPFVLMFMLMGTAMMYDKK